MPFFLAEKGSVFPNEIKLILQNLCEVLQYRLTMFTTHFTTHKHRALGQFKQFCSRFTGTRRSRRFSVPLPMHVEAG